METNYAKIRVCSFYDRANCTLQLEPGSETINIMHFLLNLLASTLNLEIESILAESEDPEELKYYWEQWYNLAGTPTKNNFATYVRLKNQAARLNSKFCK